MGLLTAVFPYAGLRYPKLDEKPSFRTQEACDFNTSLFSAIANYLILRLTETDAKALERNVATQIKNAHLSIGFSKSNASVLSTAPKVKRSLFPSPCSLSSALPPGNHNFQLASPSEILHLLFLKINPRTGLMLCKLCRRRTRPHDAARRRLRRGASIETGARCRLSLRRLVRGVPSCICHGFVWRKVTPLPFAAGVPSPQHKPMWTNTRSFGRLATQP